MRCRRSTGAIAMAAALLIAGIVQMFVQSAALQFVYSAVGVLLFAGMTAYDTQRIKNGYFQMGGGALANSGDRGVNLGGSVPVANASVAADDSAVL